MKTPAPRFVAQSRVDSPLGPLTLAATARGLALVWFDDQAHRSAAVDAPVDEAHPHLALATRELAAYWQAPQQRFTVPLDPQGTPFQQAVWRALVAIPFGETRSYRDVARAIGRASAIGTGSWRRRSISTSRACSTTSGVCPARTVQKM